MSKPLEAEIDALHRLPLADFTGARNALAARLKKAGEKADAARVVALEKPSASAWAVNQLYWQERGAFDALFAAAARLQTAQRAGGPDAFREAQRARREALAALVKRAALLLSGAGHGAAPATLTRVSSTLEALAGRGGAPLAMALGRLSGDLEPPGFDAFAGATITAPAPEPRPAGKTAAPPGRQAAEAAERRKAVETAKDALAEAESEVRRRRKTVASAAARADEARRAQKEAEQVLSEASQAARRASETSEKAGFEARQAGTALAEAERALEAARAVLDRAKRLP